MRIVDARCKGLAHSNRKSDDMQIALAFTLVSVVSLLVGLVMLPVAVVRIDADHFVREPGEERWRSRSTRERAWAIVRTVVGGILVLAGVVLLLIPGQGVLTIVAGLLVAEYPGKYRVERAIVRRPAVLLALNRIRCRFGRETLRLRGERESDTLESPRTGKAL